MDFKEIIDFQWNRWSLLSCSILGFRLVWIDQSAVRWAEYVFSDFSKHFRKVHFRGLFNSLIAWSVTSAMIPRPNLAKSMDFIKIFDFQWFSMIFHGYHSCSMVVDCSRGVDYGQNLFFRTFFLIGEDSVDNPQKIDIFTFSDRYPWISTDISSLGGSERIWSNPSIPYYYHYSLSYRCILERPKSWFRKNAKFFRKFSTIFSGRFQGI